MRIKKYGVIFTFFLFLLFFTSFKVYAAPTSLRIGGTNRYDTAIKISQNKFLKSDYAVLVQGEDFPDALCAAPLAKKYNAPILLVKPTGLDNDLMTEISRLGCKNVLIVGGTGAVSDSVETQLKSQNILVKKRYSGVNRFDTSAQIAQDIGTSNGVIIASGENFPDGLSASSIAASKQMPILLVMSSYIPSPIQNFISNNSINKFYVIGDSGVIFDSTISKLQNVRRVGGTDRYQTNLNVLNEFKDSIDLSSVYVASGKEFPDALGGSAAAALTNSPVLLTNSEDKGILEYVNSNKNVINNFTVLGGSGAVTDSMAEKLLNPSAYIQKVLGYATYYYYNAKECYNALVNNYTAIDEIATNTFSTDAQGNLIAEKGYNSSGSLVDLIPYDQISFANSKNVDTYFMITSGSSNADATSTLLRSSTNRQNLINNVLKNLSAYNYKGVNIDIEGIHSSDRSYFTQLMKELWTNLKSKGYTLTIAVPGKTKDDPNDAWSGGYDYAEIAKYVDQVVVRAYEEHWSGGTAGPIASIGWVTNVVNYSISAISRDKILLGLGAYGYDWATGVKTKAYTLDQAYSTAGSNGASIIFDNDSKCPHFDYVQNGVQHSVWFENGQSVGYKLDLVNNNNLGGVAIWNLGQTNQEYWNTIRSKLNK